jgi:hypothetical protein
MTITFGRRGAGKPLLLVHQTGRAELVLGRANHVNSASRAFVTLRSDTFHFSIAEHNQGRTIQRARQGTSQVCAVFSL